jgi:hypothetical protein
VLASAAVDEVVAMVSGLESLKSATKLMDALRAGSRPAQAARVA